MVCRWMRGIEAEVGQVSSELSKEEKGDREKATCHYNL